MEKMRAEIQVHEDPDGVRVTISYEDGHVTRISCSPDSIVLKRHLGLGEEESDSES